jgi:hypothetical protein
VIAEYPTQLASVYSLNVSNIPGPYRGNLGNSGVIKLFVAGDNGADYEIDSATNLLDVSRQSVFTTNSAATPFTWSDSVTNGATFYRALIVP